MPSFFTFQTGDSSRALSDSSPLLGRFRAVPDSRSRRASLLRRRSAVWGYGYGAAAFGSLTSLGTSDDRGESEGGRVKGWGRNLRDLWLEPKSGMVARAVERWWWRWLLLVGLPAVLVSLGPVGLWWVWTDVMV